MTTEESGAGERPAGAPSMEQIREAIRRRIEATGQGHGHAADQDYVAALDEATGGMWSVTYEEEKPRIDYEMLPLALVVAVGSVGTALLISPLLLVATLLIIPLLILQPDHTTNAALTVPTAEGTVVRSGSAADTGQSSRTRALAEAIRTLAGERAGERAGETAPDDGVPKKPRF